MKRKLPTDIADSIISVGRKCKDTGINEVIVFSIVHRMSSRFDMKINEVNSVFKDPSVINNLTFIDNPNINNSDKMISYT